MSLIIDIADAVVAEINAAEAGTFAQPIAAARKLLPEFGLGELADLRVIVVPRGVEISGASRSMSQFDVQIDIGVLKKVGKSEQEIADLCQLVEQISDYLRKRPLADAPHVAWVRTENDPVYSPEHLAEKRTFTSVLTLTYRAIK